MGSEAALWKKFRKVLQKHDVPYQRFEDSITGGIPDVAIALDNRTFWIEMKHIHKFPTRFNTVVLDDRKLRPNQIDFLVKWGYSSGSGAFILTQVGGVYYLHHWKDSVLLNQMNTEDFKNRACLVSTEMNASVLNGMITIANNRRDNETRTTKNFARKKDRSDCGCRLR